ncbi:polyketide synthase [Streptococcus pneumoniae]|nr:polyketide synthase [Streptococcus pneumoniae]
MAADYLKHVREVQPHGPYRLLGWSLGGNVVHAMAAQLQNEGEEVELLVMLDSNMYRIYGCDGRNDCKCSTANDK